MLVASLSLADPEATHFVDVIAAGHKRYFVGGRRTLMYERRATEFIYF